MAAGVVPKRLLLFGVDGAQHFLDRRVLPFRPGERLVGLVHVGLVVLAVVDPHRLLVDVRLQGGVVVRQGRQLERHRASPLVGSSRAKLRPTGWKAPDNEKGTDPAASDPPAVSSVSRGGHRIVLPRVSAAALDLS